MKKMSAIKPINYKKSNNGYYSFSLKKILDNKNLSINKIINDTETDYKVLKRLMTGDLSKIDIIVLSRICDYLNCTITDIFEYFPNNTFKN